MTRSYSDPSYGSRKTITLSGNVGLATEASLASALGYQCMYPCKVVDANITFPLGLAGDLGTSTNMQLVKSTDNGTGVTAFCTCDFYTLLATCTFAAGETVAYAPTETSFSAGDEILFQIEGTVGEVFTEIEINLETIEVFEEADT